MPFLLPSSSDPPPTLLLPSSFPPSTGYLGIPPCLWGSAEEGLSPPPRLSLDTRMHMVKRVNNTHYHFGVMGQWQMRGAWA